MHNWSEDVPSAQKRLLPQRNSFTDLYIYIHIYLPKTKKFGCVDRGDLTLLFKSCEIDKSQGKLVY